jgi:uncharacterized protein YkwD
VKRFLLPLAAAALVLAGVASASGPSRVPAPVASTARIFTVADLERQTLLAINAVRRDHGLLPLRLSPGLAAAARDHSLSMAEHGFFGHAAYDGSAFSRRITPVYRPVSGRRWEAGENLAWASPGLSAGMVIELWMASAEHRTNLLTSAWRDIGIGAVHALAAPGVYQGLAVTIVTADFGAR